MKVAPLLLYLTSEVSSRSCRVNVPNNREFYRNPCGIVSSLFTPHIWSICSRNSSNGLTPTTQITSNVMEIGQNALKQVYICLCNATPGMASWWYRIPLACETNNYISAWLTYDSIHEPAYSIDRFGKEKKVCACIDQKTGEVLTLLREWQGASPTPVSNEYFEDFDLVLCERAQITLRRAERKFQERRSDYIESRRCLQCIWIFDIKF